MKPRMRQCFYMKDSTTMKLSVRWLCVGAGCYVYAPTAEQAYEAWKIKRARRWAEHLQQPKRLGVA